MRKVQGAIAVAGLVLTLMVLKAFDLSAQPPSHHERLEEEGKVEERRRLMEKRSERELSG